MKDLWWKLRGLSAFIKSMFSSRQVDRYTHSLLHELFDPVRQAERALLLEEYERTRTDPYCWYCRKCGATGENADEETRTTEAMQHVDECSWGRGTTIATDSADRLLHVWSY